MRLRMCDNFTNFAGYFNNSPQSTRNNNNKS